MRGYRGGQLGWVRQGLTHFWKASWLLRKGKKEGSQISPWSRQASVQDLPVAASQALRECAGGQAPGAKLALRVHSRWVALGARMKGLCGARAPGGAGPRDAQKSCGRKAVLGGKNGAPLSRQLILHPTTPSLASKLLNSFIIK